MLSKLDKKLIMYCMACLLGGVIALTVQNIIKNIDNTTTTKEINYWELDLEDKPEYEVDYEKFYLRIDHARSLSHVTVNRTLDYMETYSDEYKTIWTDEIYKDFLTLKNGGTLSIDKQLDIMGAMAQDVIDYYIGGDIYNKEFVFAFDPELIGADLEQFHDDGIKVGHKSTVYIVLSEDYFNSVYKLIDNVIHFVRYELGCDHVKVPWNTYQPWEDYYFSDSFNSRFE